MFRWTFPCLRFLRRGIPIPVEHLRWGPVAQGLLSPFISRMWMWGGEPVQPHGRGVRRAGPGQPAALAGNSPVYGPGWEFPLVVAEGVAGKPGLFLPGRTVYFCHSSQGCSRMTLYGYARVSVREPELQD